MRVQDVQKRLCPGGGVLGIEYGCSGRRKMKWLNGGKKRLWKEWMACEKMGGKGAGESVLVVRSG